MEEREKPKQPVIKFKLLTKEAKLPTYAHEGDAGFDISTTEEKTLNPDERHAFSTGLASEIPPGYYVQLGDRSGHALKHGLHVLAGKVDERYRDEWKVVLVNMGDKPYPVEKGEKIAQGELRPRIEAKFEEVEELPETDRGPGFGSSGKR